MLSNVKAIKKKPWIIFTNKDLKVSKKANISQRAASEYGRIVLSNLPTKHPLISFSFFEIPERIGYNIKQAFEQKTDTIYSALNQVSKASLYEISQANELKQTPYCLITIPTIIINGCLFECYINEHNEEIIDGIESGTVFWRNRVLGLPHTIIKIETFNSLEKNVRKYVDDAYFLSEFFEKSLSDIKKKWNNESSSIIG